MASTDEVWRLQGASDEDALMFQSIANKGHYRKKGGSRQGIYILSPSGQLLSSVNSLNPDVVLEIIEEGLKKWDTLPATQKSLPENFNKKIKHRWEDSYPVDGLILQGAKSDLLSDPPSFDNRGDRWNMDYIWFNRKEALLWLPKDHVVGSIQECPELIKERLFRFHFVDNVRGQTLPFASEEIKLSKLSLEVKNSTESILSFSISGHASAVAKGEWLLGENDWTPNHTLDHGIKTQVLGSATFDKTVNQFTEFELVVLGKWFGKTQNNGRKLGPDQGNIGIFYTISNNIETSIIAPAFVDMYNADWIKKPS